ncbi:MAG: hypothetical protein R2752_04820 [Vicinamibacterales bacterium]
MRKRGTGPLVILTLVIALGTLAQDYWLDVKIRDAAAAAREADRSFGGLQTNLADLRAAQAGYVAVGQSADYWMTRVSEILGTIDQSIQSMQAASTDLTARGHYENAASLLGDIRRLDERARDNATRSEKFLASDQIFMDGFEANRHLADELAQARDVAIAAADARTTRLSWLRIGMNAVALGFVLAVMLFYARAAAAAEEAAGDADRTDRAGMPSLTGIDLADDLDLSPLRAAAGGPNLASRTGTGAPASPVAAAETGAPAESIEPPPGATAVGPPPAVTAPPPPPVTAVAVNLSEAAELCVDLARLIDTRDVPALLGRAARVMDAKGVVLWVPDADGRLLRPSLAHGYDNRAVARMGPVPVDGESVTSAAFRTMKAQTAHSPTPKGNGAIAVPLISADGCVGVLAAEIRQSKPSAERTAIARVIAAQFAVLVPPAAGGATHRPAFTTKVAEG